MKIQLTDEDFKTITAHKSHYNAWMDLWGEINGIKSTEDYRNAKQAYVRYLKELRRKSLEEDTKRWSVTL